MKYLFIDSATANLVVAIIKDNKIAYLYNENDGNDTSSKIMPVVAAAFEKANIRPNEIDKIFAVTGPGSFTGIRVGLTVAKTMAWSLKIPVIPISSLEVMCSGGNGDYAIINARRGYVFMGGYDKDLNVTYKDKYVLFDGSLKGKFITYDDFSFKTIKPEIDILKVINKHKDEKGVNPHGLNPNYLKLTEAEEKLNNKND